MNIDLIRYLGLLNILLYMDVVDLDTFFNSKYVKDIIHDLNQHNNLSKNFMRRLTILNSATKQDENFANTKIIDYTNKDQCAALFQDQNKNYYIGFRGTRHNEWKDNVISLSGKFTETKQQKNALKYFEYLINKYQLNKTSNKIYIFGHSKGGNKAQYIILNSKYANCIEKVYSYNAQTFSPEAVRHFKSKLTNEDFENKVSKIYSVCTNNDPINCLGYNKDFKNLIKQENIIYLESNLIGVFRYHFHDSIFNLDGTLTQISKQKDFSKKCQNLSKFYMARSPFVRNMVGKIIVNSINAARAINFDKVIDSLAIKREHRIFQQKNK